MSRQSRIALLVIITIFLVAAIFSVIPGDSPLKYPSVLVITIAGALSALAQFTGIDVFRKLFKTSILQPRVIPEDLLKYFIEHHLLVRCAAIGRPPIYQLDKEYWTNLILDFPKIAQDSVALNMCADCVRSLLPLSSDSVFVIEPLDLGQSQPDIRQTIEEIAKRMSGQFVRIRDIHNVRNVIVLAGVFSPQIRNFLLQEVAHIDAAIFLVGPDSNYLSKVFRNLPLRLFSIVSIETLQKLDLATRRAILHAS